MAQILTEMAEMENVTKALFLQGDPFYHQIKCLVRTQDSAMGLMLEGKFLEACKTILGHVSGGLAPGLQWTDVQDRLVKWLEEQPIDR